MGGQPPPPPTHPHTHVCIEPCGPRTPAVLPPVGAHREQHAHRHTPSLRCGIMHVRVCRIWCTVCLVIISRIIVQGCAAGHAVHVGGAHALRAHKQHTHPAPNQPMHTHNHTHTHTHTDTRTHPHSHRAVWAGHALHAGGAHRAHTLKQHAPSVGLNQHAGGAPCSLFMFICLRIYILRMYTTSESTVHGLHNDSY